MNRIALFLAAILGAASLALGQATTMPAVDGPVKVLVIPFAQIGNTGGHEWVGAALQENLMTDVSSNSTVQAIALDRPLARGDMTQVTAAAKGTDATLVVFGAYQYTDSQLRVTGEVVDVNNSRVVGTLKATGALIDLFKIEDSLTDQLQSILPQPPSNLPVVVNGPPDQSAVPMYVANAPTTDATTTPTYVYPAPSTTYVYSYPAYSYPYYYGGGYPIYINAGWGWGRPWYGYPRGFVGVRPIAPGFHGGFGGGAHFSGGFGGGHGR
jgi:TolB-like protein